MQEKNVKRIDSANILLNATITNETINQKKKKIAQNISKNIKIDGFRKGKVPLSVVESRFKDKILQDSQGEILNDVIKESLKELDISMDKMIGNPLITRFQEGESGLEIEAKIGIFPDIDLVDYERLIPIVALKEISSEEIDSRINALAKSSGEIVEKDASVVESGDIANIDFEGFLGDEPFEGGKGEGYDLEIGGNSFIQGFEEQIIGMKKGDTKDINVKFPDDYNAKNLAGKEARFRVKLNAIKKRKIDNIDDKFAKKMLPNNKDATLKILREHIKTQLENESKNKAFDELKPTLIENLIGGFSFDVPENIVEQEIDVIFRGSLQNISTEELKDLQNDKEKAKERRESFRDKAQKSVRLTFIIDKFAKKDKVVVTDNELYQMVYYEAMMMGANPKDIIEHYEKSNMIPALKMTILENKILNNLLESTIKKD